MFNLFGCKHTWMPWSDPIATYNSGYKQQWTVCSKCNEAKFRTMKWDEQSKLTDIHGAIMDVRYRNTEGTTIDE